jgi:hypothetical protein
MSYCRFYDGGDVYMYPHINGGIVCCACRLSKKVPHFRNYIIRNYKMVRLKKPKQYLWWDSPQFRTRTQALKHLIKHKNAGHAVPQHAFDRLRQEIQERKKK